MSVEDDVEIEAGETLKLTADENQESFDYRDNVPNYWEHGYDDPHVSSKITKRLLHSIQAASESTRCQALLFAQREQIQHKWSREKEEQMRSKRKADKRRNETWRSRNAKSPLASDNVAELQKNMETQAIEAMLSKRTSTMTRQAETTAQNAIFNKAVQQQTSEHSLRQEKKDLYFETSRRLPALIRVSCWYQKSAAFAARMETKRLQIYEKLIESRLNNPQWKGIC